MIQQRIEYVAVFKKDIDIKFCIRVLDKAGYEYKEGSDSSKGKHYFYITGPKFLVYVPRKNTKEFLKMLSTLDEIYEIYEADWNILKD